MKKLEKTLAIFKKRGIMNEHLKNGARYRGVEQLVARRAHNPKVVGSSPASATTQKNGKALSFTVLFLFVQNHNIWVFLCNVKRIISPTYQFSDALSLSWIAKNNCRMEKGLSAS